MDSRHLVTDRKFRNFGSKSRKLGVISYHQCVRGTRGDKQLLKISRLALSKNLKLKAQLLRCKPRLLHVVGRSWTGLTDQNCDFRESGEEFLDQLQSLCDKIAANRGQSGHIATGPSQAWDQSCRNWIEGCYEYYRDRTGSIPGRENRRCSSG